MGGAPPGLAALPGEGEQACPPPRWVPLPRAAGWWAQVMPGCQRRRTTVSSAPQAWGWGVRSRAREALGCVLRLPQLLVGTLQEHHGHAGALG